MIKRLNTRLWTYWANQFLYIVTTATRLLHYNLNLFLSTGVYISIAKERLSSVFDSSLRMPIFPDEMFISACVVVRTVYTSSSGIRLKRSWKVRFLHLRSVFHWLTRSATCPGTFRPHNSKMSYIREHRTFWALTNRNWNRCPQKTLFTDHLSAHFGDVNHR